VLKMGTSPRSIGTPVRCPSCRHPNLAIDIWCERCGRPLDWKKDDASAAATANEAPVIQARPHTPPAPAAVPAPPRATPKAPPPTPLGAVRESAAEQRSASKVYCWSCGTGNAPGDRFCGRCGAALTGRPGVPASKRKVAKKERMQLPKLALPSLALPHLAVPKFAVPKFTVPKRSAPAIRLPRAALPSIGAPRLSRTTGVAAAIVLLLLLVPVVIILNQAKGGTVARQTPVSSPRASAPASKGLTPGSPQAVAAAGVQAKTGLAYSASCAGKPACLSISGQTVGQAAAAVDFSTAASGGRECVGYVVQQSGAWKLLNATCALPGQVSPMVGRNATVHVPGNCARVRTTPSLSGGVAGCLYDGTTVSVSGGPVYADNLMWWQTNKGWMAHDFLFAG
jgi:Double zinc ribbon